MNTLASSWLETGNYLGGGIEHLLLAWGLPIIAILFVLGVWLRTRSGPAALGAIVMGAIVWYGVANMGALASKTADDLDGGDGSGYSAPVSGGSGSLPADGSR
ncbi:hypothetical protein ACWERV_32775 [Streptomyces sp. NPDC004031]